MSALNPYSSPNTSDKPLDLGLPPLNYQNHDGNSLIPPSNFNPYQDPYNYMNQDQNGFNYNPQNGFQTNGYPNFQENDASLNGLLGLGLDPIGDANESVTPEQLNLLRLAAQEIGGAQFASPNSKYDYNFFDSNQRNAVPEPNMFTNNFNQPNSLNLENYNYNSNLDTNLYQNTNGMRYPNKFNMENYSKETQNTQDADVLSYLNQLGLSERPRDELMLNNLNEFKMPLDLNGHYQNDDYNKIDERNKMYNFNRNFQQAPPNVTKYPENFYVNDSIKNANENKFQMNPNYDFQNPNPNPNYKPNGFHPNPNEFMQRRDLNQMIRDNPPPNGFMNEARGFENPAARDAMQQAALLRQNQELARQMNLLMRNRPPPNQLNVDVSFLHENAPFNLGKFH